MPEHRDQPDVLPAALAVPDTVAVRDVDDELVLLDFSSETYFGLDAVGSRMWRALTTTASPEDAVSSLLEELEVDEERLRADLGSLVQQLLEAGLLVVAPG